MRRLIFYALVAAVGLGIGAGTVFTVLFLMAVIPHGGIF